MGGVAEASSTIKKSMLETCFDLAKWIVLIGLATGFIFGGLVGLVLLVGWLWDKIERILK